MNDLDPSPRELVDDLGRDGPSLAQQQPATSTWKRRGQDVLAPLHHPTLRIRRNIAPRLAIERGMTRSELYSHAVAQLVRSARALGVRERLDSVYAADPRVSELEPAVQTLQEQSLERKW